jgi:membrane associated rhomboid family serine protease
MTGPSPTHWDDPQLLPPHRGTGWSIWNGREIVCTDARDAARRLRHWNPTHATFIASPGAPRFVPPPDDPDIGPKVLSGFLGRTRFGIAAAAAAALAFSLLSLMLPGHAAIGMACIAAAIAGLGLCDYRLAFVTATGAADRSRYFFWLRAEPRVLRGLTLWAMLFAGAGAMQWLLVAEHGFEATVTSYGLVYAAARGGEWWRLATGPPLHASLADFLNNAVSACFLGAMSWPAFGFRSIAVFALASSFGALSQMLGGDPAFDTYLGVSGGVFGLYGLIVITGLRVPRFLPRGMPTLLCGIGLISGLGASLLASNAAVVAHLAGFAVGAAAGLALTPAGSVADS